MKFGYFDDEMKEYVITSPRTPLPWINYLGCEDFFSLISNTCGGYSFYKDAKLLRLTRYRYNNVPTDSNGRYYYIKDGDTIWNPGWQPTQTELDSYSCRHGLGYSVILGEKNSLSAEVTAFVPLGRSCEVNKVVLKNTGNEPKTFSLYSYVEFCYWNAVDDMSNFQRNFSLPEVEIDGSDIYHKTEYRERRNHYAVWSVNVPIDGFDTDRDSFMGPYGSNVRPAAVAEDSPRNSVVCSWSAVGSHCIRMTLQPGEEKTLVFVLAYVENEKDKKWESPNVVNKTKARELLSHFRTKEQCDEALKQLKEYWDSLLSIYSVEIADSRVARMVNIWNQYQCMVTFNMSRSASYYESGTGRGMGFRDSSQDLLGFVHMIPERARQRILDIASTQFPDGSAYHQYQPLTKTGNLDIGSGFNDDPLWLIAGVDAYLRETGDFTILDEKVPFDNDDAQAAPLMEHLRRSFNYTATHLGPHHLPLIGRADWNDCLNLNCFSDTPGESFQTVENNDTGMAESVFIAGMFGAYGIAYAGICRRIGLESEAASVSQAVDEMKSAVLKDGWDGRWFLRAYDAFGNKVGSSECSEGQIFIEPQGFCVIGGIGIETGEAEKALASVEEKLDTKYGIVLLQPAYRTYHIELGEISSYPPGYKENAGIFCHNNPWISIAEARIGHGSRAFQIYSRICPAFLQDISEIHRTEPYVYSQMIAGKDARGFGESKNSWLTGTAAWNFVDISQSILGVQPSLDGLRIDPCIPKEWKEYTITRRFRGAVYRIHVSNPDGVEHGVKSVCVDGRSISGNLLPVAESGRTCRAEVVMG